MVESKAVSLQSHSKSRSQNQTHQTHQMDTVSSISEDRRQVSYQDKSDPNSLINICPEKLRRCIAALPDTYLDMSWEEKKKKFNPNMTVLRIRMSFWLEFDSAIASGQKMNISRISAGLCTDRHWFKMMENPEHLACIVTPPHDYMVAAHEGLDAGMDKLREIFNAKIVDKDGVLDPKSADVVLKAFALLDMRVKGAIIQKVQQQNVSLSRVQVEHTTGGGSSEEVLPVSLESLDSKLAELRRMADKVKKPQLDIPKNIMDIEAEFEKVEDRTARVGVHRWDGHKKGGKND